MTGAGAYPAGGIIGHIAAITLMANRNDGRPKTDLPD
jgi:hypothetical protein